ncbi:MAG: ribosome biogenesis GTPase Der [Patescibacteria group bacterium]
MNRVRTQPLPTIALVGRTNVGKSTLFNRIVEAKKALTSDIAGTTRTRNIANYWWRGREIRAIDTGGLTYDDSLPFEKEILEQVERGIKDADVVLFVLDVQTGILAQERELARRLRKVGKPVVIAINKVDSVKWRKRSEDENWKALGFGEPFFVSASSGSGVGDLLDSIHHKLPKEIVIPDEMIEEVKHLAPGEKPEGIVARIALLGKPNVGKSSLLNSLAGADEVIVSEVAHTTRETFIIDVQHEGKKFQIVDTAGIRRKARVEGGLERMGVSASIHSLDECDVVLLLLDATEPFSKQEKHLLGLAENKHAGVIIVVNKWDLIEDHGQEYRTEYTNSIRMIYPFLRYAPVAFVSAKTGFRVHQLFEMVEKVAVERAREVEDEVLHGWWKTMVRRHKPVKGTGTNHPSILSFRQIDTNPPHFEVVIRFQSSLHNSYLHFLENGLRESYGFEGTPIVITVRKFKK